MTLKEILKVFYIVEGSTAEKVFDLVLKNIKEEDEFIEISRKDPKGLENSGLLPQRYEMTKKISNDINITYLYEIAPIANSFNIIVRLATGESVTINLWIVPEYIDGLYKGYKCEIASIEAIRYIDGIEDVIEYTERNVKSYFRVENKNNPILRNKRNDPSIEYVSLENILKAIEEENWKQILWCDFAKKHIKARTREEIQITDK